MIYKMEIFYLKLHVRKYNFAMKMKPIVNFMKSAISELLNSIENVFDASNDNAVEFTGKLIF